MIPRKEVKLMEVNTMINEKEEAWWTIVDSGALDNVISEWMAQQFKMKPSLGETGPARCGERECDAKQV